MQAGALQPYEQALRTAEPVALCTPNGQLIDLNLARWLAAADPADQTVLNRCTAPVLDLGCGPGRFVAALTSRGITAMGIDIADTAITLTRRRGVHALRRCLFTPLPREGHWASVLLMDGNIGIGGDPHRLLTRVRDLLMPGGTALIETDPDDLADTTLTVRFCREQRPIGPPFTWAQVGQHALRRYAADLDLDVHDTWTTNERTFLALQR